MKIAVVFELLRGAGDLTAAPWLIQPGRRPTWTVAHLALDPSRRRGTSGGHRRSMTRMSSAPDRIRAMSAIFECPAHRLSGPGGTPAAESVVHAELLGVVGIPARAPGGPDERRDGRPAACAFPRTRVGVPRWSLPEDSGPYISTTRPRRQPTDAECHVPVPIDPVGMTEIGLDGTSSPESHHRTLAVTLLDLCESQPREPSRDLGLAPMVVSVPSWVSG